VPVSPRAAPAYRLAHHHPHLLHHGSHHLGAADKIARIVIVVQHFLQVTLFLLQPVQFLFGEAAVVHVAEDDGIEFLAPASSGENVASIGNCSPSARRATRPSGAQAWFLWRTVESDELFEQLAAVRGDETLDRLTDREIDLRNGRFGRPPR